MASDTAADLGLGDLALVPLFSPVERNAPGLNDGFDEVLAGADLLEATLRGPEDGQTASEGQGDLGGPHRVPR